MKVEYIIKCEVVENYYDDNHQLHKMRFTKYVTDKTYELIKGNRCIYLTDDPSQAKKFYAYEIAGVYIDTIKNMKFCYKNLINIKAEFFKVTTPRQEGIVPLREEDKGKFNYGGQM